MSMLLPWFPVDLSFTSIVSHPANWNSDEQNAIRVGSVAACGQKAMMAMQTSIMAALWWFRICEHWVSGKHNFATMELALATKVEGY